MCKKRFVESIKLSKKRRCNKKTSTRSPKNFLTNLFAELVVFAAADANDFQVYKLEVRFNVDRLVIPFLVNEAYFCTISGKRGVTENNQCCFLALFAFIVLYGRTTGCGCYLSTNGAQNMRFGANDAVLLTVC